MEKPFFAEALKSIKEQWHGKTDMVLPNQTCIKSAQHILNHIHVSDGTTDMSENRQSRTLVKINPTSVARLKYHANSNQVTRV